ncbi:hypothetical protein FHG64_12795 [Antarcticibacterium flavum]|uniref:NERD domain-containing protein n=1 Tax=Antarcticibacterium flavum TaxID=2058175 RepID=A0A5B7X655_9FLAO|nr:MULTISPECIES: nuclease-related domain-containing protein [Antarcticibacterium]MCM4158456.1 hypothetical protein [Antarcticibacterium sp. W02-3]QCY70212.1 hypothetical protein FHG64_12795 [Antarcticibacterium flavum]
MEKFNITQNSLEIQNIISRYTKGSFVCFFADYIRHNPERDHFNFSHKMKSKLKDSLYLIMLRLSSPAEGEEYLRFSEEVDKKLNRVMDILLQINHFYLNEYNSTEDLQEIKDERQKKLIHEMVFKDYFLNGILNYREQELNKVIRLYHPYQDKIRERLGIDLKSLIEICQYSEEDYIKKSIKSKSFAFTKEFFKFRSGLKGTIPPTEFFKEFSNLSEKIQDDFVNFYEQPHNCLLFTKEDYYERFEKKDVDIFCKLFSLDINENYNVIYYSQLNPLEAKPIIRINSTEYLHVYQKQLPTALLNLLYVTLTTTQKEKEQLNLRKGKVILENETREIFEKFFKNSKTLQVFSNYYIDNNPEEKDLLIINEKYAFVIECKSSRNREPRRDRNQAFKRIKSDFNDCIQKGYEQCYQVEQLILKGQRVSIKCKNSWQEIETSTIKDVFNIVVTSERFASIQTDLGLLLKRTNDSDLYPWSINHDDLEVFLKTISLVCNNPYRSFTEFLEYRELLNERLIARDELDVCAMYLENPFKFKKICEGKEYVIPDPTFQNYFDKLYFAKKLKFKIEDF